MDLGYRSLRRTTNVSDGSKTVLSAPLSDFCNTPGSGHLKGLSACLKRANRRHPKAWLDMKEATNGGDLG
jgi:hypothetical protein